MPDPDKPQDVTWISAVWSCLSRKGRSHQLDGQAVEFRHLEKIAQVEEKLFWLCVTDRNIESFRLERLLKSSSPTINPSPPCSLNHVPWYQIFTFFEHPQGQWLHHLPGSLFQCLDTLSEKKFFLISNLNLSWCNLMPLPLVLSRITPTSKISLAFLFFFFLFSFLFLFFSFFLTLVQKGDNSGRLSVRC